MDYERIKAYLASLEPEAEPLLEGLRRYAKEQDVPIVREETESLLRTLTAMQAPKEILEIGTAIAYSTIVMARAAAEAEITTIESYEKRIPLAEENLLQAGVSERVRLLHGDAGVMLPVLLKEQCRFDLVFLDAAKGQYINWLPHILKLMKPGGLLIADNVLQDNTVMESRFTVERRERTTHERMRQFLYEIKHSDALLSSVIPIGDGVSISVKRG